MEDKENKAEEEVSREEIEAYIKERWVQMWSPELVKIRERFSKITEDPELVNKLSKIIVKEVGEQ